MEKKICIGLFFVLVLGWVFASNVNIFNISNPSAGTYWRNGSHDITFKVFAEDVNGFEGQADLNIEVYYSTSIGAFETLIKDYNLVNTGYCGNTNNFNEPNGIICTIPWGVSLQDNNYYIDLNLYTYRNNLPIDTVKKGSESFYVDNTAPKIRVIFPTGVVCGSQDVVVTNEQMLTFDLNDPNGININATGVKVELLNVGNQQSSFSAAGCIEKDGNYHCSYKETALFKTGEYNISIFSEDRAGNPADCNFKLNYSDKEAPVTVQDLSAIPGEEQITLLWTGNTENDLNGYKIYYSDKNCDFNTQTGTYTGFTTNTTYALTGLDSNKVYYFHVLAVDLSGNDGNLSECETETPNPLNAPPKPTFHSSTHSNDIWSTEPHVIISWNADGAKGYSCSWDSPNTEPDSTIETSGYCYEKELDESSVSNGTHYLKVKACARNNVCSSSETFIVKVDNSAPSAPRNITPDMHYNGNMELRWDEPATVGPSGIKEYRVYRSTSSGFSTTSNYRVKTIRADDSDYEVDSDTYKWIDTDPGDHKGTRYYYRVTAVSNAGVEGDPSSRVEARYSKNQPRITIGLPEYAGAERITLTVRSIEEKMMGCSLEVRAPSDSGFHRLGNLIDNTYGPVEKYYTFDSADGVGKAEFRLTCTNLDGMVTRYLRVDTVKPSVKWVSPKAGSDVNGKVELVAEAQDQRYGIKEVSFYYGNKKIGTATKPFEEDKYKANWDSAGLSGKVSLKVIAKDHAGNTAEATIEVNVKTSETAQETGARSAIDAAEKAKKAALGRVKAFTAIGVTAPKEMQALKTSASAEFVSAKSYFSAKNFEKAKEHAENSKAGFEKLLLQFPAPKEFFSKEFSFDSAKLAGISAMFSDKSLSDKAKANLADANAGRKIVVYSVKDGNKEEYVIAIKVSFVNTTDNNALQLIEVIPKELVKSSDELASILPFEVLAKDPVIKFTLAGIQKGNTATISYYLKNPLSKSEVEELKASGALESFNQPSLVFPKEEKIESAIFAQGNQAQPAAMFSLAGLLPLAGIAIALVIAGFIAYLFLANRPVEEEETTALGAAIRRVEGKSSFLRGLGGNKAEEKKSRWSYKGE